MGSVPLVVQVMVWMFGGMAGGLVIGAVLYYLGTILIWAPPEWLGRMWNWRFRRDPYRPRHSPGLNRIPASEAVAAVNDRTLILPAILTP